MQITGSISENLTYSYLESRYSPVISEILLSWYCDISDIAIEYLNIVTEYIRRLSCSRIPISLRISQISYDFPLLLWLINFVSFKTSL